MASMLSGASSSLIGCPRTCNGLYARHGLVQLSRPLRALLPCALPDALRRRIAARATDSGASSEDGSKPSSSSQSQSPPPAWLSDLQLQVHRQLEYLKYAFGRAMVTAYRLAAGMVLLLVAWNVGSQPAYAQQPRTWETSAPAMTSTRQSPASESTRKQQQQQQQQGYQYTGIDLASSAVEDKADLAGVSVVEDKSDLAGTSVVYDPALLPPGALASRVNAIASLYEDGEQALASRVNSIVSLYEDGEQDLGLKQFLVDPSAQKGKKKDMAPIIQHAESDDFSTELEEKCADIVDPQELTAALNNQSDELTYSQLWMLVSQGYVDKVNFIGKNTIIATTKTSTPGGQRVFSALVPSDSRLLDHLLSNRVFIDSDVNEKVRLSYAFMHQVGRYWFPVFFLTSLFWMFHTKYLDPMPNGFRRGEFVRTKRELMNISTKLNFRSPARQVRIDKTAPDFILWEDINGIDDVKNEISEIIEYLKNPQLLKQRGVNRIGGILLAGAPGTGKTLLAKSIAGESGVKMYTCSGTDFFDVYSGVGARRVRETFELMRSNAPAILFIDEFDALGAARGTQASGDESASIINEMLVQMDGFEDNRGIVVMGATNRPGAIDAALIRPGRFDRIVYMPLPDAEGRAKILQVHARNKVVDPNINWYEVARAMSGFTGADCMGLMQRAQRMAAKQGRDCITEEDLYSAMENKAIEAFQEMTNAPKPGADGNVPDAITPRLRKIVSIYEAGKVLAAYMTPEYEEIARVSICPDGLITGYTLFVEDEYKSANAILLRSDMEAHMVVNLAGRCAEQLTVGLDEMTGISAPDLFHASLIAREMVLEFGLGKRTGPVDLMRVREQKGDSALLQRSKQAPDEDYYYHSTDMSTDQAKDSMAEIGELMASAEAKAYHGMAMNWKPLLALSEALMDRGVLHGKEVAHLLESNGVIHFQDPFIEGYGWDENGTLMYPGKPEQAVGYSTPAEALPAAAAPVLTGVKAKTWFAGTEFDAPRDADGNFKHGWHWNMPYTIPRT